MKKITFLFLVLTGFFILFSFSSTPKDANRIVVIDIGHGGKDAGVQITTLSEKDILQNISEQIKKESRTISTKIIFLSQKDEFLSLDDRVAKINEIQPDLVVSLHINFSGNEEENGVTAYVSPKNPFYDESHKYAIKLSYNLSKKGLNDRGAKDANLHLLNNSKCPAVTLEVGYLSNEKDRNYISSALGQFEIAKEICQTVR